MNKKDAELLYAHSIISLESVADNLYEAGKKEEADELEGAICHLWEMFASVSKDAKRVKEYLVGKNE